MSLLRFTGFVGSIGLVGLDVIVQSLGRLHGLFGKLAFFHFPEFAFQFEHKRYLSF
jgi:hypothetical protein